MWKWASVSIGVFFIILISTILFLYFHDFSTKDTIVAVIDSGVDYNHPDLKGKVIKGPDFIDGDFNPMDQYGHGTHVAGTILKEEPHAKILAIRISDDKGNVMAGSTFPILYAIFKGANVVNMSYSQTYSRFTQWAIDFGYAKGVRFVAASGNEGKNQVNYPAAYKHVLAIGGYDDLTDHLYKDGNTGKKVTFIAPAVDVLSSDITPQGYSEKTGTSMATAYASGVMAYLDYENRQITSSQLMGKLQLLSHQVDSNRNYSLLDINKAYAETDKRKLYLWVRTPEKFSESGNISFFVESLNSDKIEIFENNKLYKAFNGDANLTFNLNLAPGQYSFTIKAYKGGKVESWNFQEIVDHTPPIIHTHVETIKGDLFLSIEVIEPHLESVVVNSATSGQMTFNQFNTDSTQNLLIKINKGEFPIAIKAVDRNGNQAFSQTTSSP